MAPVHGTLGRLAATPPRPARGALFGACAWQTAPACPAAAALLPQPTPDQAPVLLACVRPGAHWWRTVYIMRAWARGAAATLHIIMMESMHQTPGLRAQVCGSCPPLGRRDAEAAGAAETGSGGTEAARAPATNAGRTEPDRRPVCFDWGSMGCMGLLGDAQRLLRVVTAAVQQLGIHAVLLTGDKTCHSRRHTKSARPSIRPARPNNCSPLLRRL